LVRTIAQLGERRFEGNVRFRTQRFRGNSYDYILKEANKMESTIERLRRRALQHSRHATRLWKRSRQLLTSNELEDRGSAIRSAVNLNERAIDECKKALNTIDFLHRYRNTPSLEAVIKTAQRPLNGE